MIFNYKYGNIVLCWELAEPLRFCLDLFGLEHGWDISSSTHSLDRCSHLDALCRLMFSEMVTETATCFVVKPDLGQLCPSWIWDQIPLHSRCLAAHPAWCCQTLTPTAGNYPSPPAPCQGPHPAPDRTGMWVKPHRALVSFPEASVLLLRSSEIRNRFSSFGFQTGTLVFWGFTDISCCAHCSY